MKNLLRKYLPLLLILLLGCQKDEILESLEPIRTPDWIPNQLTQPVPEWGSSTRLILPANINQIKKDIGAFGAHLKGHIEGLDHIWLYVDTGIPIRSWGKGTVTKIEINGDEYFITIEYDDGLVGVHSEITTSLVSVGQQVNAGDPVGYGLIKDSVQSAEFALYDKNRNDGIRVNEKLPWCYVSPFDYLRSDVKDSLELEYTRRIITPYISLGTDAGMDNKCIEPYLTNPLLIHKFHKGTITGEWLLKSQWGVGGYPDVLILLDVVNPYFTGKKILGEDDNSNPSSYIEGPWSADIAPHHITFESNGITYYGLYELDETGERASLKIEYRTGSYPDAFSSNSAYYVERINLQRRDDARKLGVY